MFRLINLIVCIVLLAVLCVGGYWYMTVPQPAKMEDQITFAMESIAFKISIVNADKPGTATTWRDLARAGNSAAQLHQAKFLFNQAKTNPTAYNEALAVLSSVAEKGIPEAQNAYGVMLRDGLGGVGANKIEAYKWFSLAAQRGSKLAENNLLQLAHELTASDQLDGENRASTWMLDYLKR